MTGETVRGVKRKGRAYQVVATEASISHADLDKCSEPDDGEMYTTKRRRVDTPPSANAPPDVNDGKGGVNDGKSDVCVEFVTSSSDTQTMQHYRVSPGDQVGNLEKRIRDEYGLKEAFIALSKDEILLSDDQEIPQLLQCRIMHGFATTPIDPFSQMSENVEVRSKYHGVKWDPSVQKWRARIQLVYSARWGHRLTTRHVQDLGLFDSQVDAARAYDLQAIRHKLELNLPDQIVIIRNKDRNSHTEHISNRVQALDGVCVKDSFDQTFDDGRGNQCRYTNGALMYDLHHGWISVESRYNIQHDEAEATEMDADDTQDENDNASNVSYIDPDDFSSDDEPPPIPPTPPTPAMTPAMTLAKSARRLFPSCSRASPNDPTINQAGTQILRSSASTKCSQCGERGKNWTRAGDKVMCSECFNGCDNLTVQESAPDHDIESIMHTPTKDIMADKNVCCTRCSACLVTECDWHVLPEGKFMCKSCFLSMDQGFVSKQTSAYVHPETDTQACMHDLEPVISPNAQTDHDCPFQESIDADTVYHNKRAGRECKALIKRLGLTVKAAADEAGATYSYVGPWFHGKKNHWPSIQAQGKLMMAWMAEARNRPTPESTESIIADNEEYNEADARKCKDIIKRLGLSQQVAADEAGACPVGINHWLNGKKTNSSSVQKAGKLMVAWMAEARDRPTPELIEPEEYDEAAARKCKDIIKRLGLTVKAAAGEAGANHQNVYRWLIGVKKHLPRVQKSGKLMVAWMEDARKRLTQESIEPEEYDEYDRPAPESIEAETDKQDFDTGDKNEVDIHHERDFVQEPVISPDAVDVHNLQQHQPSVCPVKQTNVKQRYTGVRKKKNKYAASIWIGGGWSVHLGYFSTDIEAAKAYDRKAIELNRDPLMHNKTLNFPDDHHDSHDDAEADVRHSSMTQDLNDQPKLRAITVDAAPNPPVQPTLVSANAYDKQARLHYKGKAWTDMTRRAKAADGMTIGEALQIRYQPPYNTCGSVFQYTLSELIDDIAIGNLELCFSADTDLDASGTSDRAPGEHDEFAEPEEPVTVVDAVVPTIDQQFLLVTALPDAADMQVAYPVPDEQAVHMRTVIIVDPSGVATVMPALHDNGSESEASMQETVDINVSGLVLPIDTDIDPMLIHKLREIGKSPEEIKKLSGNILDPELFQVSMFSLSNS